jgi:hypothetical protein
MLKRLIARLHGLSDQHRALGNLSFGKTKSRDKRNPKKAAHVHNPSDANRFVQWALRRITVLACSISATELTILLGVPRIMKSRGKLHRIMSKNCLFSGAILNLLLVRSQMLMRVINGLVVIMCLFFLAAAVAVFEIYGRWPGYFRLINLWQVGWIEFVLMRIVALFLVALAVVRLWRWSRLAGALVAALVALGLSLFVVLTANSPTGIYGTIDEKPRCDGDHYYLFAHGEFHSIGKSKVIELGHYEKTGEGWILIWAGNSRYKLKSSWFGVWATSIESPESGWILGRRIVPCFRPEWIPVWMQ